MLVCKNTPGLWVILFKYQEVSDRLQHANQQWKCLGESQHHQRLSRATVSPSSLFPSTKALSNFRSGIKFRCQNSLCSHPSLHSNPTRAFAVSHSTETELHPPNLLQPFFSKSLAKVLFSRASQITMPKQAAQLNTSCFKVTEAKPN